MPDMYFDVDAALAEVPVNIMPLVDDTDFKTIEGAVAYNASGMALRWHFSTTAGSYTVTSVTPTTSGVHDWIDQGDAGIYTIEIPASAGAGVEISNNTEGYGWFTGKASGILPWRGPVIAFRASALNNALIDSAWDTNRGLAGTALPAAAADASGGLAISDTGGLDLDQTNTNITAILEDTAELQEDWENGGRLDLILDTAAAGGGGGGLDAAGVRSAIGLASANLDTQLSTIDTEVGDIDDIVDDIILDTAELQEDWANDGRLDVLLDSAAAGGGLDAAGVRSAVGLASANLDTQLSTINTVVDANAVIITKVDSGLEEDGTGIYRWTTNAMELSPGGATNGARVTQLISTDLTEATLGILAENFSSYLGAGGAAATEHINSKFFTTDEKNQIRYMIGIDGTTAVPASNTPALATAATQTTILSRIGTWTGSGVNTILGAFQSLLSKTATAPSDIGGTFAPADDSVEAIRDRGDAEWTSGGGGSTSDWTSDEREEIRYRLGLDGAATAPSSGTPTLPVNVTQIEGADPSDTINAACDASITDASLATAAGLTTTQGVITTAITALNDLSAADVNTEVDTGITDAVLATAASLTAARTSIEDDIAGLQDVSLTSIGTQVASELSTHGAATSTNVTDAVTALQASITSGHTTYDAATAADLTAAQTAITAAITALNNLSAADVNTEVDTGITDAVLATAADLTATQTAITAAITALNDLSAADVNTEVDTGITDAVLATAASLTAARTSIENDIAGLQDVSLTSIGTQVASELSTHGAATSTNVSDAQTAITTAITGLDDVDSTQVQTACTSALTSYDAATGTDVTTSTSTIQTSITGLSSGTVACTVTGVAQESGRITLKRGNPSTLVFTVAAIAMDNVLLGIRDTAGNSMLKMVGVIDSSTQCTFEISATNALNLIDGDDHNLDVFEVDGYNSATGAYTDAKHLASSPVTVQPLYLRLETN